LSIWVSSGFKDPVLYRQKRVGLHGVTFDALKFRSMRTDAESDGKARWSENNDDRITRIGSLIRRFRIDELPQIFNVLKGDMSFVGPRPERPEFVAELSEDIPYYLERHCVKPGLTGWAQVSYPYGSSTKDAREKLQYDLYYVKNHAFVFDMMILLQTLDVVLWGRATAMPDERRHASERRHSSFVGNA
jgi:lipopolysaccharide/colanic/teichoic acid biosynthesis glycosyltransferase